ncbi:hypothetical protein QYM36_003500, partial [Artemia franciscana]
MISVRIVNVDYYLARPLPDVDLSYNVFRGFEIPLVPIIRIFGVTLSGQKACLHVHGVFPYFYIPYDQRLKDSVSVANSIDITVNNAVGKRLANTQHVHNITTVSGIPMYGYYDCEYQFLKVFFYNPVMAKKAGELLLGGNINGIVIQPHEAHVPYILQFFMDYNLQGMNLLHLAHFKFRRKPGECQVTSSAPNTSSSDVITELKKGIEEDTEELVLTLDPTTVWNKENIPESMYLEGAKSASSCDIEIDVIASDILNQLQLTDGVDMNPGLSVLWEEETKRRENLGLSSIVQLPSSPERPIDRFFKTKSDKEYLLQLKQKLDDRIIPDIIRPPVGLKGQEVAFPVESQNQTLTPATIVDVHIEGELSRSFGLIDTSQPSQTSSFYKKSQEISFDQSDLDCIDLLEQLQEEATETHLMPQASQNNEIDDDSILRSQIPDLKPNKIEQDSSDDEVITMTQTHWADDSFMVSQLDNSEITSGQRQGEIESESEDEIFGPSDESDEDKESKAADGHSNKYEELDLAEQKSEEIENMNKEFKEEETYMSPKYHFNSGRLDIQGGSHVAHIDPDQRQNEIMSISEDEIIKCSDESDENEKLFALDGQWDTSDEPDSVELKTEEHDKKRKEFNEKEHYLSQQADLDPEMLNTECDPYPVHGPRKCKHSISYHFSNGKEVSCRSLLIKNGSPGKLETRFVNLRSLDGYFDSSSSDDDYDSEKGSEAPFVPGILSRSRLFVKKRTEDSSVEELLDTSPEISTMKKTSLKHPSFRSRKNEIYSSQTSDPSNIKSANVLASKKSSERDSCSGVRLRETRRSYMPISLANPTNREESTSPEMSPCKRKFAQIKRSKGASRNKKFDKIPLVDISLNDESLMADEMADEEGLNLNYDAVNEIESLSRSYSSGGRSQLTRSANNRKSLKGPQNQFTAMKGGSLIKGNKCIKSPATRSEVLELSFRGTQLKKSRGNELSYTFPLDSFPMETTCESCEDGTSSLIKGMKERSFGPELSPHKTSEGGLITRRILRERKKVSQSFSTTKKHYELRSRGPLVSGAEKSQNSTETKQETVKGNLRSCSVILNDIKSELQRYNADKKVVVTLRDDRDDFKNCEESVAKFNQTSRVPDTKESDNKPDVIRNTNVSKLNEVTSNLSVFSSSCEVNSTGSVIHPLPGIYKRIERTGSESKLESGFTKVERHTNNLTKDIQIENVNESERRWMISPSSYKNLSLVPNSSRKNYINEESPIGSSEIMGSIAPKMAGYNIQNDIAEGVSCVDTEFSEDTKTFKKCSQQSASESASTDLPCSQNAMIEVGTTPSTPSVVDILSDAFIFEEGDSEELEEGIENKNKAALSPASTQLSGGFIRYDPYSSPPLQPENITFSISSVSQNLSDIAGSFDTYPSDDLPVIPCGQQIVSFDGLTQSSAKSLSDPSSQREEEIEETSKDGSSSTIIGTDTEFSVRSDVEDDSRCIGLSIPKQRQDSRSINDHGNEEMRQKVTLQLSKPPCYADVEATLRDFQLEEVTYTRPFWGNLDDSKIEPTREIAGTLLRVDSNAVDQLPNFSSKYNALAKLREQYLLNFDSEKERDFVLRSLTESESVLITPLNLPPAYEEVNSWLINLKPSTKKVNDDTFSYNESEETKNATASVEDSLAATPLANTPVAPEKPNAEYPPTFLAFSPDVPQYSASPAGKRPKSDKIFLPEIKGNPALNFLRRRSDSLEVSELHAPGTIPEVGLSETRESTPQASRKRRLSRDYMIGKNSILKRKRLTLQGIKSSTDLTISPIPTPSSPLSPVLRRMLYKRTANVSQSQIRDPALQNSFGFKVKFQNLQDIKSGRQYSHLTTMALEIFVLTRIHMKPNPEVDEVSGVFYSILNDVPFSFQRPQRASGCILVSGSGSLHSLGIDDKDLEARYASNELELMNMLVECVMEWNPDIVVGYEIEMLSWGYILQRGKILGLELDKKFSRLSEEPSKRPNVENTAMHNERQEPEWESYSGIQIQGRIVLNLWRLLKDELPVQSYTYENMAFHILHQRVPSYSFKQLSDWWKSGSAKFRYYVIEYFVRRSKGSIDLIEQLNLIGRTSELARLFGIQFYEVFSRGSQWRVESLMLRLAKAANMISVSPSIEQRARMKAPEFLPLILEPQSRFYVDPVLVLDFQSLYPSVIIAHNYCFSTCIGRLQNLG